jgi:hypothetical protein
MALDKELNEILISNLLLNTNPNRIWGGGR